MSAVSGALLNGSDRSLFVCVWVGGGGGMRECMGGGMRECVGVGEG